MRYSLTSVGFKFSKLIGYAMSGTHLSSRAVAALIGVEIVHFA